MWQPHDEDGEELDEEGHEDEFDEDDYQDAEAVCRVHCLIRK